MVRIEVLSLFRRGHDTFYPGEIRFVDDADAAHFCRSGWARSAEFETGTPDTADKTLDVHNSRIGHAAPTIGVK